MSKPVAWLVQEVLLILEECWNNSPELQNVPIYQASGLARRAISVYQTYIEMMNDDIKQAFQVCMLHACTVFFVSFCTVLFHAQRHICMPITTR